MAQQLKIAPEEVKTELKQDIPISPQNLQTSPPHSTIMNNKHKLLPTLDHEIHHLGQHFSPQFASFRHTPPQQQQLVGGMLGEELALPPMLWPFLQQQRFALGTSLSSIAKNCSFFIQTPSANKTHPHLGL